MVRNDASEDAVEDGDLVDAPEKRRGGRPALAGLRARADGEPGADRVRLPLRNDRLCLAEVDEVSRRTVSLLADENRVRRRSGLKARRGIDDVARDHRLPQLRPRPERDDRLACVNGQAHLQIQLRIGRVELSDGAARSEGRAHRTLRIVAVRDRRTEDRHDGVADELLDRPAEGLDLRAQPRVIAVQDPAHVLGIELLGACGETHQIGEEDSHDLPLLARTDRLAGKRACASVAEAGALGILVPTARTDGHGRKPMDSYA